MCNLEIAKFIRRLSRRMPEKIQVIKVSVTTETFVEGKHLEYVTLVYSAAQGHFFAFRVSFSLALTESCRRGGDVGVVAGLHTKSAHRKASSQGLVSFS